MHVEALYGRVDKASLFSSLPKIWPRSLLTEIREFNRRSGRKLVILDDDPTGTQTVHDVYLLSQWSVEKLAAELEQSNTFFVLTNSRSLSTADAACLTKEIGANLRTAAQTAGVQVTLASRSDSTLRGHYPAEVEALAQTLETPVDATILLPFFAAGGRYTVDDVHYVQQDGELIPAAQTEFARDRAFSFSHSHLPSYVEEKTNGRIRSEDVISVGLDTLRISGSHGVHNILMSAPSGSVVVVNAADHRDIEVFVRGLLEAETNGRVYIYRTAADFVRVRAGISVKPTLDPADLTADTHRGGLMIVASHTAKSTEQLHHALAIAGVEGVEIPVPTLLDAPARGKCMTLITQVIADGLEAGRTLIAYTSRQPVFGANPEQTLEISRTISDAVCRIIADLPQQPRFLIAKGGITSHDVAIKGLGVERALIVGQLQPGVPVWEIGQESKFPGMRYVVYPGNVGTPLGLAEALNSFGG